MRPHEVTKLGIGRTFQNIRLFGTMSALDNVLVGQHPDGNGDRPTAEPLPVQVGHLRPHGDAGPAVHA